MEGLEVGYRIPEADVPGVKKFTFEARSTLESEGFQVYQLTGKSIADLMMEGKPISVGTLIADPNRKGHLKKMRSHKTQVAINPTRFILPLSAGDELSHQQFLVENYSQALQSVLPDVQAVIGDVADYAELFFKFKEATGEDLLNPIDREGKQVYQERPPMIRTKTRSTYRLNPLSLAMFGNPIWDVSSGYDGLDIVDWHQRDPHPGMYIAPLLLPRQ